MSDPGGCLSCEVRGRNEWCSLGARDLARLDAARVRNVYAPGQVIFYQGSSCLGLHCIERGTVALRKADALGNSVIVRLSHPGDTLGQRTFFGGGAYTSTAEALTVCTVCFVDKACVRDLVERSPELAGRFLRHLADDVREAEQSRLDAVTLPVRARLVQALLSLTDRYGVETKDGAFRLDLPLARQDLAAWLGVRPESIARAVRGLEDDGLASFAGRSVRIPSLDALLKELPEGA